MDNYIPPKNDNAGSIPVTGSKARDIMTELAYKAMEMRIVYDRTICSKPGQPYIRLTTEEIREILKTLRSEDITDIRWPPRY